MRCSLVGSRLNEAKDCLLLSREAGRECWLISLKVVSGQCVPPQPGMRVGKAGVQYTNVIYYLSVSR